MTPEPLPERALRRRHFAVLRYPLTVQGSDADDYHGEIVADPYRWLENTTAPETTAWIAAQNALTRTVLAGAGEAERAALTDLVAKLADYPRDGGPFERGGRSFQFHNSG